MDNFWLIVPLVFAAGYVCQRGRTCAVSAAFEIAKRRRARRFLGFLYAAACSLLIISLAAINQPNLLLAFDSRLPTISTIIGGIIFGVGAFINGRCSLGTIAKLGGGDGARIGTIIGIFAGIWIGLHLVPTAAMTVGRSALVIPSPLTRVAIAVGLLIAFGFLLRYFAPKDFSVGQWSLPRAMTAVGVINGLLIWFAHNWSYTSFFRQIAYGSTANVTAGLIVFAVLVAGSVTAGVTSGQFAASPGTPREWLRALCGGLLMGVGILLIPGGNDTMLLVGLPLLLPQLIAAYAVMYITLIGIAYFSKTHS